VVRIGIPDGAVRRLVEFGNETVDGGPRIDEAAEIALSRQ
jgi:hypothetical protein